MKRENLSRESANAIALGALVLAALAGTGHAETAKSPYPAMAPIDQ